MPLLMCLSKDCLKSALQVLPIKRLAIGLILIGTGLGMISESAAKAASQTCPQRFAPDQTIRLIRKQPEFVSTFTRKEDQIIEKRVQNHLGRKLSIEQTYLHGLLPQTLKTDRAELTFLYDDDFQDLDRLPTTKKWLSEFTLRVAGKNVAKGVFSANYRGKGKISIGKCTYEIWKVQTITEINGKEQTLFEQSYAPALGISLKALRVNPKGKVLSGVVFDMFE